MTAGPTTVLARQVGVLARQVRFTGTTTEVPMLAEPAADQRSTFDLIDAPIPLSIK